MMIIVFLFSIQRLLKKRFPHLNPFRKNSRLIPKFRGEHDNSFYLIILHLLCLLFFLHVTLYLKSLFTCHVQIQIHVLRAEGVRKNKQKGSSRSVRRMKMLDSYLDRLLRCEAAVTQGTEVTQFFTPKEQELQPDYTKNRLGTSPLHCARVLLVGSEFSSSAALNSFQHHAPAVRRCL